MLYDQDVVEAGKKMFGLFCPLIPRPCGVEPRANANDQKRTWCVNIDIGAGGG